MQDAPFKSNFAILDVKEGREDLRFKVMNGGKVRVRVEMEINAQWSDDDGVSIEFSGDVLSIKQFR